MQGEAESPRGGAGEAGEQAGGGGEKVGGGGGQAGGGEEAPGQPPRIAQAALPSEQTGENGVEEKLLFWPNLPLPAYLSSLAHPG